MLSKPTIILCLLTLFPGLIYSLPQSCLGRSETLEGHRIERQKVLEIFNAREKNAKGSFCAEYWRLGLNEPISRFDMFGRFLLEYNLIGMNQDEVLRLLGEGRSIPDGYDGDFRSLSYSLYRPSSCISNGTVGFKLNFVRGRLINWSFTRMRFHDITASNLISTNVVINDENIVRDEFESWPAMKAKGVDGLR